MHLKPSNQDHEDDTEEGDSPRCTEKYFWNLINTVLISLNEVIQKTQCIVNLLHLFFLLSNMHVILNLKHV